MPTILTSSQQTFVDITDQRKLSAYITSNLPKTQSEDPNALPHAYAPSWATSHLVLTPVIFLDQSNVALDASGLTISWKRKDGTGAETALSAGEAVSGGILTVSQNKLADSASGMITYICYISYYDSETKNTVNISSDITYTLVKNAENARLAYVTADTYVFKYNTSSALVGAAQATLSAQVQGVSVSKWQYLNSSGVWTDYPTTSDNTSITGGTLVVKPAHAVFFNNVAQIRLVTDDPDVFDTVSITKMYDGEKGEAGQSGSGGLSVILGNEAQNIACTSGGLVQSAVEVTIPFTGYVGITQTACTCEVGALPSGVTVKSNTAATASASGAVVLAFASGATLGGASVLTGTIDLTFTVSGKTVDRVEEIRLDKIHPGQRGRKRGGLFHLCAGGNGSPKPVRLPDLGDLGIQRRDGHYHRGHLSMGQVHGGQMGRHQRGDFLDADGIRGGHCEYPVLPLHHELRREILCGCDYRGGQIRPVCIGNALHWRVYRKKQLGRPCALCHCPHQPKGS